MGWLREEFEALAADFAARGELTEEWITVLRQLWTAGSPAGFEGRHYRFAPLVLLPRPDRPIPIVIGGIDELIVEVPEASTERRLRVLASLREALRPA